MDHDQISLDLINQWSARNYKAKGQEKAALQCLIIEALEMSYMQGLLDAETARNQKLGLYDASN